jgi:hypothetical protein
MRIALVLASALAVVQLGFGFVGTFHFGVRGPSDEPYRAGCSCKMCKASADEATSYCNSIVKIVDAYVLYSSV